MEIINAAGKILQVFAKACEEVLDGVTDNVHEDPDFFAITCDWRGRDARARIEGTYSQGRWSYEKRIFGIKAGTWYCCLTRAGAKIRGIELDK